MAGTDRRKAGLYIEGWSEFIRDIRGSADAIDVELKGTFKEIAEDVRKKAAAAAEGQRPRTRYTDKNRSKQPQHWRALVETIRSGATGQTPYVAVGSAKVPWALGFEFGGQRTLRTLQFPPWRGSGEGAGYFLWPTIERARETIEPKLEEAANNALRKAFPELAPGIKALI